MSPDRPVKAAEQSSQAHASQPRAEQPLGAQRPVVEHPVGRNSAAARRRNEADAWGAFGLVTSGVLVWGGVGGLIGAWLSSGIPVMIGLLVGMSAGLYLVWFRYGRA